MPGQLLIVDGDASRRAALRAALGRPVAQVAELEDPALLTDRVARSRPDLLLLDGESEAGLLGLRRLRAAAGAPLPAIAFVPGGRPDLRLAALVAGADDAMERGTGDRLLQARVRNLLRQRDDALDMAPGEGGREMAWPGLAEAPAAFGGAPSPVSGLFAAPGASLAASLFTEGGRPQGRIALLSAWPAGAVPPPEAIGRLLQAEVERLRSASEICDDGRGFDLVVIDGAGTRGDLVQGAKVLALLADLQGRQRGGPASTLVLLPGSAVETAALALDLGASDVVAGPLDPPELALRARALIVRRHLRRALRDQVRLGLRAAITDPLTGLHNRRYAEAAMRRMGEGEHAPGAGMALLMIDIDHFKAINDSHGHAAGDRVLMEVARRLRGVLRPTDLIARVGGEEFLVALPGATPDEAGAVAERLRRAIDSRPFLIDAEVTPAALADRPARPDQPGRTALPMPPARFGHSEGALARVRVTVSLGVATGLMGRLGSADGLAALLRRADAALYEAKGAGRNAVSVSAPAAA